MERKRVYVADDDEDILHILETILVWEGFEVIKSKDGLSLTTLHQPPDMVFLDISMEISDGSQICYEYKRNPQTAGIPVVLVSADLKLKQKAKESGADGVLRKPFGIKDVAELTQKHIGGSK